MGVSSASTVTERIARTLDRVPGGITLADSIEFVVAWARSNSLWPLIYGTACCAMEMMSAGSSRHDWARFGVEVARATPRQADLIVLAGTIVEKMGKNLVTLYEQMPGPKYVIAMGSCAVSGGPFYYDSYSVIKGGDRLVPVDVYVPGCPPRPEALLFGIMELQKKIMKEGRRNPWKIGTTFSEPFVDIHSVARKVWAEQELQRDEHLAEARKRFQEENPDHKIIRPRPLVKKKYPDVDYTGRKSPGLSSQQIVQRIQQQFPAATLEPAVAGARRTSVPECTVTPDQYLDLVRYLKEDKEINMNLLLQVTAVDWQDHFEILVHLLSTVHGHKIFVRCPVSSYDKPELDTLCAMYRGAEWHEREIYDLFGIRFTGHPDLRRIFLPDDFPGHPMRKDFEDPDRVVRRPY